jgi:ADP-ribose pyrophosphatase YjhB (NUDIX family)
MNDKKIVCHDVNDEEYEIDSSQLKFRPSVYGVIIGDGKILLSKQWDGYDFPGGGMELGETVEEALKREVKKETGLDVETKEIVYCGNSFFKSMHGENFMNCILMYFLCEVASGKVTTEFFSEHEKEYLSEAQWIDLRDVKNIKFYNSVDSLEIIKKARKLTK